MVMDWTSSAKSSSVISSMIASIERFWLMTAEQDLTKLFNDIKKKYVREGLKWSEAHELVPVAFGVKKIVCTAVINQNLSMDAIIEEITEEDFADEVQSMTMTSMSLL